MKSFAYFPGCSLEKMAVSYHVSALETTKKLGVKLQELEDWNCKVQGFGPLLGHHIIFLLFLYNFANVYNCSEIQYNLLEVGSHNKENRALQVIFEIF